MKLQAAREVDIYPVGVLAALQCVVHAPKEQRRWARRRLIGEFRYIGRQLRRRNFRAARMSFNGYLAEPRGDDVSWTRCGHGWTRGRAWDDLKRHIAERAAA